MRISYKIKKPPFLQEFRFISDYSSFVDKLKPIMKEVVSKGTVVAFQQESKKFSRFWVEEDADVFRYSYFTNDDLSKIELDGTEEENLKKLSAIKCRPGYSSFVQAVASVVDYNQNPSKWNQLKILETISSMSSILESFEEDKEKIEINTFTPGTVKVDWGIFDRVDILACSGKLELTDKIVAFNAHADISDFIKFFYSGGRAQTQATYDYLRNLGYDKDAPVESVISLYKTNPSKWQAAKQVLKEELVNIVESDFSIVNDQLRSELQTGLLQKYKDDAAYKQRFKEMQGQTYTIVSGCSEISFNDTE